MPVFLSSRTAEGRCGLTLAWVLAFSVWALPALAQSAGPTFPALTGRVVDDANLLTPETRAAVDATLKAEEDKTSDQVVVATVPSLGGLSVEDYANRLFRTWKLGQTKTDNGVLFLVAPAEKKARIEVGYGLEGTLTDAVTGTIIRVAVTPHFRTGDFSGGIRAGVDAVIGVLNSDAAEWQERARQRPARSGQDSPLEWVIVLAILAIYLALMARVLVGPRGSAARYHRRSDGTWIALPGVGGSGWSGGSGGGFPGGGGFSGGGFSGGGGSSGGGGASGSW